jgi:hypothetical protein
VGRGRGGWVGGWEGGRRQASNETGEQSSIEFHGGSRRGRGEKGRRARKELEAGGRVKGALGRWGSIALVSHHTTLLQELWGHV